MRLRFLLGAWVCACLASGCSKAVERTPAHATESPSSAPAPAARDESVPRDRLPSDTHPERYALTLEVAPDRPTYRGTVAIDVTLDRARDTLWLHSRGPRVGRVSVEREGEKPVFGKLERVGDSGLSAVRLSEAVGPGAVRLVLPFEADFGTHLSGLYRAEVAGAHYAFTQFEAISAREAFPCFDEPRFKTPFAVTLRVPKGYAAVANTRVQEELELPGGLQELRFSPSEKLPTYLVALAVGPLDIVAAPPIESSPLRPRAIPLRGVAVHGRGSELAYALAETPPLLTWLERYFGVGYPYDKLDLLAVPDFGAGAMENAGAITFRDSLLLVREHASEQQKRSFAYVNAHELAHQWFGNLVTMPWWDDIWLNEAFATWMGTRALSAVHPEYQAEQGALSATHGAMELDSRASARKIRQPIQSDHDIENAFDEITYSKGGAVLSMFERYLGPAKFQAGLRRYMERYRFGSATSRDLVRTLAEVAGEPALEGAFFSFLDQPGVPRIQMQLDCSGEAPVLTLSQRRYAPIGAQYAEGARWQVPVCIRYASGAATREQCTLLAEESARLTLETPMCPTWLMPNAGAQGYYRWSLSEIALDSLTEHHAALTPVERMSLASNLTAALRAGEVAPARVLAALRVLAKSPDRHVVESVLHGYAVIEELLDDASLPTLRAEIARLLGPAYRKRGGLATKPGAPLRGEDKLWRASLVRALYGLAEDAEVTRELARLGEALLESGELDASSRVPAELVEVALSAALRTKGAPLFERAEAMLLDSSDGLERGRLLSALASVREPALSARVLALSLDPRLRTNERLIPLFGQSDARETRAYAFAWLREHFDALREQLGTHGAAGIVESTSTFCSEDDAREVEAFFAPRKELIAGGPRELSLTLETIRTCAAVRTAQANSLALLFPPR